MTEEPQPDILNPPARRRPVFALAASIVGSLALLAAFVPLAWYFFRVVQVLAVVALALVIVAAVRRERTRPVVVALIIAVLSLAAVVAVDFWMANFLVPSFNAAP